MTMTAFERAGGFSKIRVIVADLYDRVLESDALQHHFAGVDMQALIDHQTKFIASLMGGPASYPDEALRRQHARLNITRDECAELEQLLCTVLDDHDIAPGDIETVVSELRRREHCIVSQSDPAVPERDRAP